MCRRGTERGHNHGHEHLQQRPRAHIHRQRVATEGGELVELYPDPIPRKSRVYVPLLRCSIAMIVTLQ